MKNFITFLREQTDMLDPTYPELSAMIAAALTVKYEIAKKTSKRLTIRIKAKDRSALKSKVEKNLKSSGIKFEASNTGGSIGSTIISMPKMLVQVLYKPLSGGMTETTLNSTITELAPVLAFNAKKKFSSVEKFYEFLLTTDENNAAYVNAQDAKQGVAFIETFPESSKFDEKMENAIGVLDYLWKEHAKYPIKGVWWGYRAKPVISGHPPIPASHKGDIFLLYKTGNVLGVSLKAGGAKTAEPQLNTFVNVVFDKFKKLSDKETLKKKIYKEIHSKLGFSPKWAERSEKKASVDFLVKMQKTNMREYDDLYNKMLSILRDDVIRLFNANINDTKNYIESTVIGADASTPLVVVKAIGKTWKYVTDENAIELFLPKVNKITATKSPSSKQNWFITLSAGSEKLVMNMSIRSNASKPNNKLAQGFNLAIKFNGIK